METNLFSKTTPLTRSAYRVAWIPKPDYSR